MAQNHSIEELYNRYLANDLDGEELQDFLSRMHNPPDEEKVKALMDNTWNEMFDIPEQEQTKLIPLYKRPVFKWIAAASIIIIAALATFLAIVGVPANDQDTIAVQTNDVEAPKETRAVITLADGSKVYLDSADNGTIATENNVRVVKNENGEIVYSHEGTKAQTELVYNTLFNPRGSKVIDMTLSDGSHVWLNAGSSITYPVAFTGTTREVSMTGEAYFEIAQLERGSAKNARGTQRTQRVPFIVKKGDVSVTVLGTHFNVNAYDDEDALKVTLLEGSVQVSAKLPGLSSSAVKITPGEQALINQVNPKISRIEVQTNIDTDAVMAWKNGVFNYNGASLQMIMREVARWYDVEVIFEKNVNEQFYAEVTRNTNISTLLKMLETTKAVKFRVEGKKIIVTN
jgi:transmembrane sensor